MLYCFLWRAGRDSMGSAHRCYATPDCVRLRRVGFESYMLFVTQKNKVITEVITSFWRAGRDSNP